MSHDLIKFHLKTVEAALRSPFAVFALTNSSEDLKALDRSASALAKTILYLHDVFMETECDTTAPEFLVQVNATNRREYEAHYFKSNVLTGHSPFIPQMDKKKLTGVMVKLQHKQVVFCSKSIQRLARKNFEDALRKDEPITFKEAKRLINAELQSGGLASEVPLVEKFQDHFFYIDFKNQVILAKSAHRSRDAINMFFSLLLKAAKVLQERHPEFKDELEPLLTDTFKERLDVMPYSNYALTHQKAFGAYSIHDVIVHYCEEERDKDAPPLPVLPTDTVGFVSETQVDARIEFRNSVGYFLNHASKTIPSYRTLSSFSEAHQLKAVKLRVIGEIPQTDQIKRYIARNPEGKPEALEGETLTLGFDTKASDGNITFRISDGLQWPVESAKVLLMDLFGDTHVARKQLEPFLLKEFGELLEVLHHSCSLFIDFYTRANQAGKEISETDLERDLKKAQEDAKQPLDQGAAA